MYLYKYIRLDNKAIIHIDLLIFGNSSERWASSSVWHG